MAHRVAAAIVPLIVMSAFWAPACAPSSADSAGVDAASDTVLSVNGTELFVHREGTGEPVLVVHGGPVLDHGYLVEPLRPLAGEFELIFYDQRLSGRSAGTVDSASVRLDTFVADIEAIRAELGLGRVHLMGHSWGGLLAAKYATIHSDRLRSLVLLSPLPPTAALWREEQRAEGAAIEPADTAGMGALRSSDGLVEGDPAAIEALLKLSFRGQLHDPSLADSLTFNIPDDYMERSRQFGYMAGDLAAYDLRPALSGMDVPTLLVYGRAEVGATIGRDAWVASIPHTTAVAIPDAGHFPFIERPDEFTRVVRAFLVGVGAGPAASGTNGAGAASQDTGDYPRLRRAMVERQVAARGVRDTAVLRAMRSVPRHRFVPEAPPRAAYSDRPLPIGHGQTISQPYIVAFMAEAARLEPGDRVLEIGTGSGYGAAVLAELAAEVYTIEIVPELADRARRALDRAGYENVRVRTGNGWLGWPEHAPYDAVVVTAAPDEVPEALIDQLAVGGMLVIPVGSRYQELRVLRKTRDGLQEEASLPVRFVPMVEEPPDTGR
ncbi:MAG: protein-L-isoaspartate(D-aspartate) O-methyltransferase [Candidatus Longimicrobiales bacterium M2_2A_002]